MMDAAALVQRIPKTVVSGGAVVGQGAGVVKADAALPGVGTAVRVDDVTGGLITDPGMEPDGSASFSPPRFIGSDDLRVLDRVRDFLIRGSQFVGGAEHDACRGAGVEVQAVGCPEA